MDAERNKMMFNILSEECTWQLKEKFNEEFTMVTCRASGRLCVQENCEPFRFAKFFNRPEIRN